MDRDGVINENRDDNVRAWDHFTFETGSLDAVARLGATDFRIFVITNQSGIGRGHMTRATVDDIHAWMIHEVELKGGRIDRVYYCPHTPEDACTCRKPLPEMLYRGRDEFNIDLSHSYMIGDWVDDIRRRTRRRSLRRFWCVRGAENVHLERSMNWGLHRPPCSKT